jgi:hypothetical protein
MKRFDVDMNEASLDPSAWRGASIDEKRSVAYVLTEYCEQSGSAGWVEIRDYNSDRKLAKFSKSTGFKIYE